MSFWDDGGPARANVAPKSAETSADQDHSYAISVFQLHKKRIKQEHCYAVTTMRQSVENELNENNSMENNSVENYSVENNSVENDSMENYLVENYAAENDLVDNDSLVKINDSGENSNLVGNNNSAEISGLLEKSKSGKNSISVESSVLVDMNDSMEKIDLVENNDSGKKSKLENNNSVENRNSVKKSDSVECSNLMENSNSVENESMMNYSAENDLVENDLLENGSMEKIDSVKINDSGENSNLVGNNNSAEISGLLENSNSVENSSSVESSVLVAKSDSMEKMDSVEKNDSGKKSKFENSNSVENIDSVEKSNSVESSILMENSNLMENGNSEENRKPVKNIGSGENITFMGNKELAESFNTEVNSDSWEYNNFVENSYSVEYIDLVENYRVKNPVFKEFHGDDTVLNTIEINSVGNSSAENMNMENNTEENDTKEINMMESETVVKKLIKPNESIWDGKTVKLQVGLTFQSRDQVKKFLSGYGDQSFCSLAVTEGGASNGCKSRTLKFSCSYGHGKDSVAKEDGRPIQHSKKKDCKVFVRFYCRGNKDSRDFCVLTGFSEEHNHVLTKAMYFQDTHKIKEPDELEFVDQSVKLNVKAPALKNHVKTKFDKPGISTNHVRYMMSKLKSPANDSEELNVFLEKVVEEGGNVEILMDKGKVRVLTVQTSEMRKAYLGISPNIVSVDTTFNFNSEGYKMSSFAYCNPVTTKGEVGQLAFMADEGAEALEFAFKAFRKTIVQDSAYIMVDKDFTELSVLAKVFPNSIALLCQFHVMKYMKTLVSTAQAVDGGISVDYDKKIEIMEKFRNVLYATTDDDAEVKMEIFDKGILGIRVRIGNGDKAYYANLNEYFEKNWKVCADKWMTCKRRGIPGFEDENTNNRLERLWRSMKDYLKRITTGTVSISKAVVALVIFAENQIVDRYTWQMRHTLRIAHSDPAIAEEYREAAKEINDRGMMFFKKSVDLLLTNEDRMEVLDDGLTGVKEKFKKKKNVERTIRDEKLDNFDVKIYEADDMKCNCSWSVRCAAPCRHILLVRRSKGLPMFTLGLFSAKFYKERCQDLEQDLLAKLEQSDNELDVDVIVDDLDDVQGKVLNRGQKFRKINPLSERLLEATLRCGTKKVEVYEEEMRQIIENAKNGRSLFARIEESPEAFGLEDKKEDTAIAIEDGFKTEYEDILKNNEKSGKSRFNLSWHSRSKAGRVGRPRESKVKFVKRKNAPGKENLVEGDGKPPRKVQKVQELVKQKYVAGKENPAAGNGVLPRMVPRAAGDDGEVVCTFPLINDNPRRYAVYETDLECLRPRRFITNDIVDFQFRYMQPTGPSGQPVWLLTAYHAQQLHSWAKVPSLQRQVEAARLFEDGGTQVVFMAWCEASHFFGCVGVCGVNPAIYVLESIGGYTEPEGVTSLRRFMREMQILQKLAPSDIEAYTPDVPRQAAGSNDCGLFMLESAARVLESPDDFIQRVQRNQLSNWYPSNDASRRRTEIASLVLTLGQEQRQVREAQESAKIVNAPDPNVQEIKVDVESSVPKKMRKARKCGICRDVGHSRIKCPMKEI